MTLRKFWPLDFLLSFSPKTWNDPNTHKSFDSDLKIKISKTKYTSNYNILNFEPLWENFWPLVYLPYKLLFGLEIHLKWNWFFLIVFKIFNRVVFPYDFWQKKSSFRILLGMSWYVFEPLLSDFLMNCWTARSHLVTFSSKKNQTSNDCKPIRLLLKNLVYQYVYIYTLDYNIENFE